MNSTIVQAPSPSSRFLRQVGWMDADDGMMGLVLFLFCFDLCALVAIPQKARRKSGMPWLSATEIPLKMFDNHLLFPFQERPHKSCSCLLSCLLACLGLGFEMMGKEGERGVAQSGLAELLVEEGRQGLEVIRAVAGAAEKLVLRRRQEQRAREAESAFVERYRVHPHVFHELVAIVAQSPHLDFLDWIDPSSSTSSLSTSSALSSSSSSSSSSLAGAVHILPVRQNHTPNSVAAFLQARTQKTQEGALCRREAVVKVWLELMGSQERLAHLAALHSVKESDMLLWAREVTEAIVAELSHTLRSVFTRGISSCAHPHRGQERSTQKKLDKHTRSSLPPPSPPPLPLFSSSPTAGLTVCSHVVRHMGVLARFIMATWASLHRVGT